MKSLPETAVDLLHFAPRIEKHGDEEVLAGTLKIAWRTDSFVLAEFGARLRDALYWHDPAGSSLSKSELEQVFAAPVNLRCPEIAKTIALKHELVGALVTIPYGVRSEIRLDGAKVDRFTVEPHEGGSVTVGCRILTGEIDEETSGRLCALMGQEIRLAFEGAQAELELEAGDD